MPGWMWSLLGVLLLLFVLFLQFRWNWYPLQYLYFLRFPIILGTLLVFCFRGAVDVDVSTSPLHWQAGAFLNLFLVDRLGLVLTGWLGVFYAWAIVHSARWIYAHSPGKVSLTLRGYRRVGSGDEPRPNCITVDETGWRHVAYALLATPLILSAVFAPFFEKVDRRWLDASASIPRLIWPLVGALIAFRLRWLVNRDWWPQREPWQTLATFWVGRFKWCGRMVNASLDWLGGTARFSSACVRRGSRLQTWLQERGWSLSLRRDSGHAVHTQSAEVTQENLRTFLPVALVVYGLFGAALWPGWSSSFAQSLQGRIPAIVYLLLLLMLLTWLLAWVSLQLDKFRIAAEVALVVIAALIYRLGDTDHYYRVTADSVAAENQGSLRPTSYVESWKSLRASTKPIVVAASGGGITASYWTALVLTELQRLLGSKFAESILLLSTTSGGGLGALYYVDAFQRPPDRGLHVPDDLVGIRESAARTSLGALAWGVAYPDFIRLLWPKAAFKTDRGWALERRWAQRLKDKDASLASWRRDSAEGWRPAVVFNATFTETGGRFLLSAVDLASGTGCRDGALGSWHARSFTQCYPGGDVAVVTAARLSATFPYVTPVAAPLLPPEQAGPAYHVGDGGYFDNLGVMSAIDFLEGARTAIAGKVLIIEIRASDSTGAPPLTGEGFRMETIGPLDTLMAVRSTSQLERSALELSLMRGAWGDAVEQRPAVFELRTRSPLSWHLSEGERGSIDRYWSAAHEHNLDALRVVAEFLGVDVPSRERIRGGFGDGDATPADTVPPTFDGT